MLNISSNHADTDTIVRQHTDSALSQRPQTQQPQTTVSEAKAHFVPLTATDPEERNTQHAQHTISVEEKKPALAVGCTVANRSGKPATHTPADAREPDKDSSKETKDREHTDVKQSKDKHTEKASIDSKLAQSKIILGLCGHAFEVATVQQHVLNQAREAKFPIRCPKPECGCLVLPADVVGRLERIALCKLAERAVREQVNEIRQASGRCAAAAASARASRSPRRHGPA